MKSRCGIALLCAGLFFGGTAGALQGQASLPIESVTLPEAIDRVLRDYETGWRAGDEAALAALFTEDGFIMQGGRPATRGRAAIQAAYANSQGDLYLIPWNYAVSGDVGFIIGGFALAEGDRAVGKFVLTLRRVEGRWYIQSDMDNSGGAGE